MKLVIAVLVVLSALSLPAVATASQRLDGLAAGLRERELVVHPDLLWLLDEEERDAVQQRLAGLEVPVLVALVPLLPEDESGGDHERVLLELIERTGRPGLYVIVDQFGGFAIESDRVPRDILVDFGLAQPSSGFGRPEDQRPPPATDTIIERLERLVSVVQASPPGAPEPADRDLRPIEPLYAEGALLGSEMAAATVVGALLGLVAHGLLRFIVLLRRPDGDAR